MRSAISRRCCAICAPPRRHCASSITRSISWAALPTGRSRCSKASRSPRGRRTRCCAIPVSSKPISAASMLALSGLNVHYGKIHVLRDVALRVAPGEVVGLVGPNAAGKTTTLRTLIGLKGMTSGEILFDEQAIGGLPTPARVRRGLVLVPEGRQVFPKFSVLDNLTMGAFSRPDRNALAADLAEIFALFPRLEERRSQRAGLMSGGEQQMLAIGRGLMAKPRMLLLDEPTLGLAPIIVEEIERIVATLAKKGMTILIAEQNAAMALRVSHRVYVLTSGRISLEGTPAELSKSSEITRLYLGT